MEHATCSARPSRARSVWLRLVLALGLLFGMGTAAAQCALSAQVGTPYSQSFNVTGGAPPYTWSISAGALPAGLGLTGAGDTAYITGTPTAGGNFSFTLRVVHATGSGTLACTLAVSPPNLFLGPPSLAPATFGQPYSGSLTVSGGTAPHTFALTAGALPAGLTLDPSGAITGTPTVAGIFMFSARATDSSTGTGPYSNTASYSLTVAAPTITLSPGPLPAGTAGVAYSHTLTASGGRSPYTWSLVGAVLPAGVTFDASGVLSGTPTEAGTFSFTARATDADGFSGDLSYTLDIAAPTIAITPATLPAGTAGTAYAQSISASGGVAPYTWSLAAGALPTGMAFSSAGVLSGTPTVAGSFNLTLRATDANGFNGDQAYTLVIAAPTIAVTPTTLPAGTAGTAYSQSLSASGGVGPYSWSLVSGALPTGMAFSSAGVLSGTPTVAGNFNVTLRATDANGFVASQAYALAISAPTIAMTPTTLPAATAGTPYTQALGATGGVGPYGYALASGALPAGLSLSTAGTLAGSPTVVGTFNFSIRATDANGFSGTQAYALSVAALVPVAASDSARTTALQPVTVDVTANDTNGPFVAASVLSVAPLNAGTARIAQSGSAWLLTFVPDGAFSGTATIRYTVSNAYATSAAGTLSVTVDARPDPSRDPDVLGLLSAQANATRGFARAQVQNVQQRLESLHGGANGNGWHNGLSLANARRCERDAVIASAEADACARQLQALDDSTAAPQAPSAAPVGFWTAGSFGSGDRDARFGRSALDFETRGINIGADYRVSSAFVLGASFGYGRDRTDVGAFATRADGEAYSAAAYASWSPSASTFVDAVFGYQRLSFDTRRTVATTGATVTGSRDGTQWFGALSTGVEFRHDGVLVAPYARVDLANATLDGYAERGDAVYALRYGRQDVDTGTASVGLRMEKAFRQDWGVFTPLLRVEHQHDFQGQGSTLLQYADLPAGPYYRSIGDTFDRSRWLLGVGTGFAFSDALALKFEYLYVGDGQGREQSLRLFLQGRF